MNIVLGVDKEGNYSAATRMLARLRFTDAVVEPVHVVTPPSYYFADPYTTVTSVLLSEVIEDQEAEGKRIACVAQADLQEEGLQTGPVHASVGSEVGKLIEIADERNAELIAVGCSGKSEARAFFTGSVGRGLTISANQCLLVAKGELVTGPVRAVLATDHSAYANGCVAKLLELAPQGIDHLTIMTAYPEGILEHLLPYLPDMVLDPNEWVQQGLEQRNQQLIQQLSPLGCEFTSRVIGMDANSAIEKVMLEEQADLLILGAQGHGFMERLTVGSVSFHQVVAEPYSTLVLRVRS